jgi:hypothetical protein
VSQLAGSKTGEGGISIRIDASTIDELSRPRLMYLWRE